MRFIGGGVGHHVFDVADEPAAQPENNEQGDGYNDEPLTDINIPDEVTDQHFDEDEAEEPVVDENSLSDNSEDEDSETEDRELSDAGSGVESGDDSGQDGGYDSDTL